MQNSTTTAALIIAILVIRRNDISKPAAGKSPNAPPSHAA